MNEVQGDIENNVEVVVNPTLEQRKQKFGPHKRSISKKGKSGWECIACGHQTASHYFNMMRHIENAHMRGVFRYQCPHCPEEMGSYSRLLNHTHRATHTRGKRI